MEMLIISTDRSFMILSRPRSHLDLDLSKCSTTRKDCKNPSFTDLENSVLLSELRESYRVIIESSLTANSSANKKAAWLAITEAVNAIHGNARLPPAI